MTAEALSAGALALGVAGALAWIYLRRVWPGNVYRDNIRGLTLPVVLGLAFVVATLAGSLAVTWPTGEHRLIALGLLVVFLGGFLDDRRGSAEARGIRGHLGSLLRGRPTTGIIKILAGFAAAGLALADAGGGVGRLIVGVFVIAGATNLWNVLDVVPGRALKLFVPAQAGILAAVWGSAFAPLVAAGLGGAVAVLPFDLRERGMLGDAGSNPLGYLIGVGLYLTLPAPGLGIALVVILALQFLAETLTLSKIVDTIPPLRWYDRLGRLPASPETRKSRESGSGS